MDYTMKVVKVMKTMRNLKNMKKTKFAMAAVLSAALLVLLPCCASMQQDVSISADSAQDGGLSSTAALDIAKADAEELATGNAKSHSSRLTSVLSEIDGRLASSQRLDKAQEARLTALQGRAYLLKGSRGNAEKCYARAAAKNADDVQVIILGHRLGVVDGLDQIVARKDDNALLILELAIDSYRGARYADAAGQFDTAFLYLDEDYRNAYGELRNRAWQLKDTSVADKSIASLLAKKELTVQEMMLITQETTDILNVYTASQKQDGVRLFQTLVKEGLMNSVSNESSPTAASMINRDDSGVVASTPVTRLLAARFLWNLYWRGGGADPQKYSAKYRAKGKSPVKDLSVNDGDFDAVMGCVEKELLELKDGVNFGGDGKIGGAEFNAGVKKLD